MENAEGTRHIVGNFEVTLNLTDKRGIKMLGYVYDDDTPKEINDRVDLYQDVLDRQFIRSDIINKSAQIQQYEASINAIQENYNSLVTKQADHKLTSQDKLSLGKSESDIRQCRKMIESLSAAIAEGRKLLAA
jgi:hypothetical protein